MRSTLRQAVRATVGSGAQGALAVVTLSVAIAALAVTLCVLDTALLHPLPYQNIDEVFRVYLKSSHDGRSESVAPSLADMRRWQQTSAVSAIAGWNEFPWGCVVHADVPQRVRARRITESYFGLHGRSPTKGRDFSLADTDVAAPPVAILGYDFWREALGGADVLGRAIRCDTEVATIVGVLPPRLYRHISVWFPLRMNALEAEQRAGDLTVEARFDAGVSAGSAQQQMIVGNGAGPTDQNQVSVELVSLLDETVDGYRESAQILSGAVAIIVAVACINVAGLLLVRNTARRREMAVRVAIGASRTGLLRQLFAEAVVLVTVGMTCGLVAARLSLGVIAGVLPFSLPEEAVVSMNGGVLAAIVVFALAVSFLFALMAYASLRIGRLGRDLTTSSSRLGAGLSRRAAQILMAGQVALAMLVGAAGGLVVRSYDHLMGVDLGFEPSGMFAFGVAPIDVDADTQFQFYSEVLNRVSALPQVAAAGFVDHFPLSDTSVSVTATVGKKSAGVGFRQVFPGYFAAMGIESQSGHVPVAGEAFDPLAAVVNRSAAKKLFEDVAEGKSFSIGRRAFLVKAVIPDIIHGGPLRKARPEVFVPYDPNDSRSKQIQSMTLVVRSRDARPLLPEQLIKPIRAIGPAVVIERVRSADDWLADRIETQRNRAGLFSLLGAIGLLLMIVGVVCTTTFIVSRRTKEIGIRLALGAHPWSVIIQSHREVGWPILAGIGVGLGSATLTMKTISSFLYGVTPTDVATLSTVALVLTVIAMTAALLPARRAASVDPVITLRRE